MFFRYKSKNSNKPRCGLFGVPMSTIIIFFVTFAITIFAIEYTNVATDATISVFFGDPVAKDSIENNFIVEDGNHIKIDGVTFLSDDGLKISFKPYEKLKEGTTYYIVLKMGLSTVDGKHLEEEKIISFQTVGADTSVHVNPDGGISSTPTPEPENTSPPKDVSFYDIEGHWAEDYILSLSERKIINGYEDIYGGFYFAPNNSITRYEFAKVISLSLGIETPEEAVTLPFMDRIAIPSWAKPHVSSVYDAGLMLGRETKGNTIFDGDAYITRAEIVTIIGRALNEETDLAPVFIDNDIIPDWSRKYVALTYDKNIVSGYPDNTFKPQELATRAETVKMIYRMLEILDNK